MRIHTVVAIFLAFFTSLAISAQTERTIDIFAWPLSDSKSQTLAKISYNSTHATVKNYTKPKLPPGDEIVRIGFHHLGGSWSGVSTAASNFAPSRDKKVQLHLNTQGQLYHVGFKASNIASSSKTGQGNDDLGVEVIQMQKGPTPHLNKPVVLSADGLVPEKEEQKTFLQKYWWVIGGFLILQVFISGTAKE
ncbi:hypothetical protein LTR37_013272 [Vermiconidia calcicola]|uniref:Uncharacterized protein n=1 Tax=Vermiconidia calcicola TaxID=1690605 RepID=A0ACC3MXG9_9PEZI|nr:hypothetical protein LTR37_013272 [Vermiconidia calcicola]